VSTVSLQDEIEKGVKDIATEGYPMSIGELMNLYRDGELDLHPEFQRFFRWKDTQKSRLIESVLLGIPMPSIFVSQRTDGVWDVIDGLQRLSTIFEFAGELKDETGLPIGAPSLLKTRYLPSLEGKYWNDANPQNSLTDGQRRIIKRAKLDIKIIKSESSDSSKYELFQRLNTGGTTASDQEVRNCLMIMTNRPFFQWIESLSKNEDFLFCTLLTPRQREERYDLELILRFLILKDLDDTALQFEDIGDFLTDEMLTITEPNLQFDYAKAEAAFNETFSSLMTCGLADDSFKKYDAAKGKFLGSFSISGFEAIAIGLGARFSQSPKPSSPTDLVGLVQSLWTNQEFLKYSGSGVRASSRIPRIVPLGKALMG
jgi:hypothetical protein